MSATEFLPGTGRWRAAPEGPQARSAEDGATLAMLAPLHHAATRRGLPPRAGEELR